MIRFRLYKPAADLLISSTWPIFTLAPLFKPPISGVFIAQAHLKFWAAWTKVMCGDVIWCIYSQLVNWWIGHWYPHFNIQHSTFDIRHSTFIIRHSSFRIFSFPLLTICLSALVSTSSLSASAQPPGARNKHLREFEQNAHGKTRPQRNPDFLCGYNYLQVAK